MNSLKLIFKGFLVSIGKIIPGVSGSMIAISLGIYEKIIYILSHPFRKFKSNIIFSLKLGIGIVLAIIIGSKLISLSLNNYYLQTMFLFIGLIIGGIPSVLKKTKQEITRKNIVILVIPFILFLLLDIITDSFNFDIEINFINAIWLGFLEALTMLIPGISGTAIMIMLGVYEETLNLFSDISYFKFLIFFIFGVIIGSLIFSRVINYFLKKYNISCYYAIMGFVISSTFILLRNVLIPNIELLTLMEGLFFMLIGFLISNKLK